MRPGPAWDRGHPRPGGTDPGYNIYSHRLTSGPPRAGARLVGTSRIEQIYEKEGKRGGAMTFAVMVTEFRDESGKVVAEARLTGVETARPPGEGA